jgi:glycosyltransferase involved in cell wall biosynthesis
MTSFAVVVIGRNEGERLRRCLASVVPQADAVVYVDSGSTDDSVAIAKQSGAEVVNLDMRQVFTAARARNAGFDRVKQIAPHADFVQFVDGDCEVVPGWLAAAQAFLEAHPGVAAACGRRRERFPERSVYNMLCDIEWNTPVGEARSCGGDVLMRRAALDQVGGYRPDLIAGEEPELCVRLRAQGWRIWRLDAEMTLHDAAMTRFAHWWKRTMRSGFAYAHGAHLHGAPPERHWVRETRSAWAWGLGIPLATAFGAVWVGPWAGLGWLVYPLQVARLTLRRDAGVDFKQQAQRALFLVLGKFPEALGQLKFHVLRLRGQQAKLIEYK